MINNKKPSKDLKKILFLDIDGVLTSTPKYIPNTSPILTSKSIRAISEAQNAGFITVFITARSVRELRLKNGFEDTLKKNNLLEKSLIYGSLGLDQATYTNEFKIENGSIVYKDGSAVLVRKPSMKRETFANLDQFLLYKMLLGREIKQQLKYAGFDIKKANNEEIINDSRIGFELEKNNSEVRKKLVLKAQKICDEQYEIFQNTKKFGSPVKLVAFDIETGISINPIMLGKHFGVLRALNELGVNPKDKIIAYAMGDSNSDSKMSIRNDIKFIKIIDNKHFLEEVEKVIKEN
ncbi:MAG TPA: hypothetical protein PKK60_01580 [archaeon]|nr:hypothetical protein [archaeon]